MQALLHSLRRLPPLVEFTIVISLAFGTFILASLSVMFSFMNGEINGDPLATENADLIDLLVFEISMLAVIAALLYLRGWRWWQFNLRITSWGSAAGAGLAVADYLVYSLLFVLLFEPVFPESVALYPEEVVESLHPVTVVIFSIVNGFYEELLVVGYVYLALAARYGFNVALSASTALRLLYHLYQGPIAVIAILPMGLLFFWLYARYRRLWPLVFAHILLDIYGLWPEVLLE